MSAATSDRESKPSIWGSWARATPVDRRNLRRVSLALLAWAIGFVAVTVLVGRGGLEGAAAWVAAIAPCTMALLVIRHYVRFLREADELLRLISLEGLALGFGAGFVFMTTWRLLERAGATKLDVDDGFLVMILFWGLGQWFAARRYA